MFQQTKFDVETKFLVENPIVRKVSRKRRESYHDDNNVLIMLKY